MNFKPILFSTPMVQAILDGRKSQTRRIVKPQPDEDGLAKFIPTQEWHDTSGNTYPCPYGQPNDILWVRESHAVIGSEVIRGGEGEILDEKLTYCFRGQKQPHIEKLMKWKPSIHIPKTACRLFLQVADVRAERLQDISWNDAVAEGCLGYRPTQDEPTDQFKRLWQSINGPESWNANPWVWVISFKRITLTEEQYQQFLSTPNKKP